MQNNPIGWVEIPVKNIERAEKFYTDLFGFNCRRQPEEGGYQMSFLPDDGMKTYGTTGALVQGPGYEPSHSGAIIYFTAPEDSVKKALEKAEKMKIKVISPRKAIGEYGYIAWLEDSEGNVLALHSMKE